MSDCLRCGSTVWVPEGNEFSDGDICYSCMEAENQRLMDLVRYQRSELHEAGLISNEEYAALVADSDSGQRVARLEGYDKLRKENSALKEQLAEARKLAQLREDALVMIYDKWENGNPCYEACDGETFDESGSCIGNAVKLSFEEEEQILAVIPKEHAPIAPPQEAPRG